MHENMFADGSDVDNISLTLTIASLEYDYGIPEDPLDDTCICIVDVDLRVNLTNGDGFLATAPSEFHMRIDIDQPNPVPDPDDVLWWEITYCGGRLTTGSTSKLMVVGIRSTIRTSSSSRSAGSRASSCSSGSSCGTISGGRPSGRPPLSICRFYVQWCSHRPVVPGSHPGILSTPDSPETEAPPSSPRPALLSHLHAARRRGPVRVPGTRRSAGPPCRDAPRRVPRTLSGS